MTKTDFSTSALGQEHGHKKFNYQLLENGIGLMSGSTQTIRAFTETMPLHSNILAPLVLPNSNASISVSKYYFQNCCNGHFRPFLSRITNFIEELMPVAIAGTPACKGGSYSQSSTAFLVGYLNFWSLQ